MSSHEVNNPTDSWRGSCHCWRQQNSRRLFGAQLMLVLYLSPVALRLRASCFTSLSCGSHV